MKEMYVILHEPCISVDVECINKGKNVLENDTEQYAGVLAELERIKKTETFVSLQAGSPENINYDIPLGTLVKVCGAYAEVCVSKHLSKLKEMGIPCAMHDKGTIFLYNLPQKQVPHNQ
ncbi:hypothetical protein KY308_00805 [Candidatus Woesearchaeota archaeon]|nr:hypothetical protein [Candidatus Woesearchaeota archaeon]